MSRPKRPVPYAECMIRQRGQCKLQFLCVLLPPQPGVRAANPRGAANCRPSGATFAPVYHTGAYDSLESLRLMEGLVDVYMPDFKLWSAESCAKYLRARDYAEGARAAIKAMPAQVGELRLDSRQPPRA